MLRLPFEIIRKIYDEIEDDQRTLATHVAVCRRLSPLVRSSTFSKQLTFRNKDHLLEFISLMSAPMGTFPNPVVCRNLSFRDAATLVAAAESQVLSTLIRVQSSFTFPLPHARALSSVTQMLDAVSIRPVRRLILVGEDHTPMAFFQFVSSFPQLESLVLRMFSFKEEVEDRLEALHAFPRTLTRLSLDRSTRMLGILKDRIMASDSNLKDLYIRTAFSMDQPGVPRMLDIIKELQGVETITLDALYDEMDNHIDYDMTERIFLPKRLLRVQGLKRLCLNLSKVPSKVATAFLGWYAVRRPKHGVEIIDIHVPSSPDMWQDSGPSHELNSVLKAMGLRNPAGAVPSSQRACLVVHGFPDPLSQDLQTWGGSAVCDCLSGDQLAFDSCDGEQIARERLEGV